MSSHGFWDNYDSTRTILLEKDETDESYEEENYPETDNFYFDDDPFIPDIFDNL